jgi:hypothetical protein
MSTPNPVLVAAAPSLIAAIQALEAFVANLGTDPLQIPVKFPGALQVLLGQLELQLPAVAQAEFSTLQAQANAKFAAWITSLQALKT